MSSISPIGTPATQANRAATVESPRAAQPLDRAKLDALRAAIQADRYPLDPDKLAARMIAIGAASK